MSLGDSVQSFAGESNSVYIFRVSVKSCLQNWENPLLLAYCYDIHQTWIALLNSHSHQLTAVLLFICLAILILTVFLALFSSIFLELRPWEH